MPPLLSVVPEWDGDTLLHILQPKRVKNDFENENKESNFFH
jgi:hypothetical protein